MIPEGADPTAVKYIIGDIMDRGIGGVKGAMGIIRTLGGNQGLLGLQIPERFMAQTEVEKVGRGTDATMADELAVW